jgi:hypothetical protein
MAADRFQIALLLLHRPDESARLHSPLSLQFRPK